ncbi:MAG: terminase small subunit [Ectothiorhodospiraceae bacterium]|nr:terminase small subunit [Ectothiorhodospiraceae bacterium]
MMTKKVARTSSKDSAARKRARFIDAYIANGGNATDAAKTAGYSEKTAYAQGHRLLKHAEVQRALVERQEKLAQKYELTVESVIQSLANAVHFDPRKLYKEDGSLKPIHELDDATADAITGLEVVTMGGEDAGVTLYTRKVKWLDKNTAREQAMKHLGQYQADNTQRSPLEGMPPALLQMIVDRLTDG